MNFRTIETAISIENVKDQIAALLYAVKTVRDNEEIVDLKFEPDLLQKTEGTVPLQIQIKEV